MAAMKAALKDGHWADQWAVTRESWTELPMVESKADLMAAMKALPKDSRWAEQWAVTRESQTEIQSVVWRADPVSYTHLTLPTIYSV